MSTEITLLDTKQVTAYANRLRELIPGGTRLTPAEAESLAAAALLHQLDPLNGELWYLKKQDGTPQGVMAGIKGLRRASSIQLEREGGGSSWCEFDGPLTPQQCKALAIPENALAFCAKLYDTRTLLAYTEACERLLKAGMPWEAVREALGSRPYTEGIGFWVPGETTRMKPVHCAQKRAEAEARRRRFNLPFGSAVGDESDTDQSDESPGQYTVIKDETPAEVQAKMQAASKSLRGDQGDIEPEKPEPAPHPARPAVEFSQAVIMAIVKKFKPDYSTDQARKALALSKFLGADLPEDVILSWFNRYHAYATSQGDAPEKAADAADKYMEVAVKG